MVGEKIKNQRNKKESGYSLIEALVALGILLLGIVPVVTMATQAILFHHRASETEEAARISQTMIDYIKSKGYDELKLMVGPGKFTKQYSISTTGSAFTVDNFGNAFNFDIPQDLILLNSKEINLNEVNFYVVIDKVKGNLKKKDRTTNDLYEDPITGEEDKNNVYREGLIYGKFIFGFGKVEESNLTKRKKEMETTFIVTPIENWK